MIVTPDMINGLFEIVSAGFSAKNVQAVYKEKQVRGVYWPFWIFLSTWGLWNVFYYPHLEQWWSTVGGIILVSVNITWTILAYKYRNN